MKERSSILRSYFKRSDTLLLIMCLAAAIFGLILIKSATGSSARYMVVQIASTVIGLILYAVFTMVDIDIIADKFWLLFVFSTVFIGSLFVFGVAGDSGNRSWLRFGSVGIQPSEICKIPFIIMVAKLITHQDEQRGVNDKISVLQSVMLFGFFFCLIVGASSDLGSALVYMFIFIVMLYVGGLNYKWIGAGVLALVGVVPFLWKYFFSQNQKDRILAPYVSSIDPNGTGIRYQANQSRMAIASGKLSGQGLYNGMMTQSESVPAQRTDFIFTVAGEELGMIGCLAVIAILVLIIVRCIYVGIRSNDRLSGLICIGIASMLIFQTLINIGMCLGLTPVIGLTLPFFSYGGSSNMTLFAAIGIVSGIKMRPKPGGFIGRYDY